MGSRASGFDSPNSVRDCGVEAGGAGWWPRPPGCKIRGGSGLVDGGMTSALGETAG